MFGFIGAAIFGVVAFGAWISEENRENHSRDYAKNNKSKYYFDKDGRMRWVNNNKKLTPDEVHSTFWNLEEEKKQHDYYHKEYWGVNNYLDGDYNNYNIELFLTKEEAENYKNYLIDKINMIVSQNPEKYENIKLDLRKRRICVSAYTAYKIKLCTENKYQYISFHKHF